jgi:hypothetical protein
MKNKKIVIAFLIVMFSFSYSIHAQSAVEKKIKADMERNKKHRDEAIMKLQEQQRQAQDERRESNANSPQQRTNSVPTTNQKNTEVKQQPNSNNSKQLRNEQPIINNANKKQDINQ